MISNSSHPRPPRAARSERGQSVVVLIIFIAAFIVGPISFFSYEVSLYNLAKQELKNCVDSAALAAGAQNAIEDSPSMTTTQNAAEATAMWMFQQQSILGNSMSAASNAGDSTSPAPTMTPSVNTASLYFCFLNPDATPPTYTQKGDTLGKIIQVTGTYMFQPVFASFIGLAGNFPITDTSNGGLPELDAVLCFDLSSSMDDGTNIMTIYRWYNKSSGVDYNNYQVITTGILYTALNQTDLTGSGIDCTPPMSLSTSTNVSNGGSQPNWTGGSLAPNIGLPPSQQTSYSGTGNGTNSYTDMIINLDGTANWANSVTVNGFTFPALNATNASNNLNAGIAVEAARGNLETTAIANSVGLQNLVKSGGPWASIAAPKAGWYAAYWAQAYNGNILAPIGTGIVAGIQFYQIINNDCDAHFGLVAYSTNEGSSASSTISASSSDSYATPYFSGKTALPLVTLDTSQTNYTQCTAALGSTSGSVSVSCANSAVAGSPITQTLNSSGVPVAADGSTDIAGALYNALNMLLLSSDPSITPSSVPGTAEARKGAKRAIVLFTDGLPTVSSLPNSSGNDYTDARKVAANAAKVGIPIYTIGLCATNQNLISYQNALLNDTDSNTSTGGIAAISGNQAQYYQVTGANQTALLNAFEQVARSLVQLVHSY